MQFSRGFVLSLSSLKSLIVVYLFQIILKNKIHCMKQLTLSIKQIYFDQIAAGTKKVETREIRPGNALKYCTFKPNGELIDAVVYDTLKLLTGAYKDKRDYLIVEVIKAEVVFIYPEDSDVEPVVYEENGEEYYAAEIDYHLGKVLEIVKY